jgi:hypothetical protein
MRRSGRASGHLYDHHNTCHQSTGRTDHSNHARPVPGCRYIDSRRHCDNGDPRAARNADADGQQSNPLDHDSMLDDRDDLGARAFSVDTRTPSSIGGVVGRIRDHDRRMRRRKRHPDSRRSYTWHSTRNLYDHCDCDREPGGPSDGHSHISFELDGPIGIVRSSKYFDG